ncbi:MAG: hypothetical protein AB1782_12310, partial [Cyanobacteriota bacterium]
QQAASETEEDPDDLLNQLAQQAASETEEDPDDLLNQLAQQAASETEEDPDDLLNQLAQQAASETEEDPDDLLNQLAQQAASETEKDPATDEDLDSLLSQMADEIEEVDTSQSEITTETETQKELPEAVKQIKEELKQKKAKTSVPIEAYYSSLHLKTPVDILLATASYLEKFENNEKFTQKDISSLTFKAIKKPISPNIMLAAVNKGYIEVVPDFTGTSESNEYVLTDTGRDYILKELS